MPEVSQLNPTLMSRILERLQGSISSETTLRPDQQDLGVWNRGREHQPFVLTCDSFARAGRYIVFWANPSSWEWTMNQRGMVQKTHGGTVVHMWRTRHRPTYYDEIALTMQFQSGNVMPIRLDSGTVVPNARATANGLAVNLPGRAATQETRIVVPPGLMNFYEYIELKDEPKILDTGSPNYVSIIACSPMFPQIVLQGYINPEGFSFSENAEDLGGVTWNDSFTIVHTYPEMRASNLQAVFQSFSGQDAVTNLLRGAQGQTALLNLAAGGLDLSSLSGNFPASGFASGGTPQNAADNFSGVPPQAGSAASDPQQNIATGAGTDPTITGTRQPVLPSRETTNPGSMSLREARLNELQSLAMEGTLNSSQRSELTRLEAQQQGALALQAQNAATRTSQQETLVFTPEETQAAERAASSQEEVMVFAPDEVAPSQREVLWNPTTGTTSPTPAQLQSQLETLLAVPSPTTEQQAQINALSAELNAVNAVNHATRRR